MASFNIKKFFRDIGDSLLHVLVDYIVPVIKILLAIILTLFSAVWHFTGLRFVLSLIFTEKIDEKKRKHYRHAPLLDRWLIHIPISWLWKKDQNNLKDSDPTINNILEKIFWPYRQIYTRLPLRVVAFIASVVLAFYPFALSLHQLGVGTAESRYNTTISMLAADQEETRDLARKDLPAVATQLIYAKPKLAIPLSERDFDNWSLLKFIKDEQVPYEGLVVKVSEHVRDQLPRYLQPETPGVTTPIDIKNFRLDYLELGSKGLKQNPFSLSAGYMDNLILRSSFYHGFSIEDSDIPTISLDDFYGSFVTLQNLNQNIDTTKLFVNGDGLFCHNCVFRNVSISKIENPNKAPLIFSFCSIDSSFLEHPNIFYYQTSFYSKTQELSDPVSNFSEERFIAMLDRNTLQSSTWPPNKRELRLLLDDINQYFLKDPFVIELFDFK